MLQVSNGGEVGSARGDAAFFAVDFFAAVFFTAVFLRAVFFAAFFAAFFATLRSAGNSAPSVVAAFLTAPFFVAVFLAAFFAPRRGRLGAASSNALHSSCVSDLGSRSFGTRAFFSPSVMYGP